MPSTFEILVFLAMILVILLLLLKDYQRTKQLDAAALRVLTDVDHSKPTLDTLELVGRLVPPDIVAGVLQLANGVVSLLPAGNAKSIITTAEDILSKATDGKPNEDGGAGMSPGAQAAAVDLAVTS